MIETLRIAFSPKKNWHQLFHRPTRNISVIDGLRALSIIMVVCSHLIISLQLFYPQNPNFVDQLPVGLKFLTNGGVLGVNVFFIIIRKVAARFQLVRVDTLRTTTAFSVLYVSNVGGRAAVAGFSINFTQFIPFVILFSFFKIIYI